MTTNANSNKNIVVNNIESNRYGNICCNGVTSSLDTKYSKEEAESVLTGDVRLEEVVVLRPHHDSISGRNEFKATESILAWLGDKGKFVVADVNHNKEQLKKYLKGWYFSGHRYGNGPQSSLMIEEALDAFCPGWYSKIENIAGPSSWRIDVTVKDDGSIVAKTHIGGNILLGQL